MFHAPSNSNVVNPSTQLHTLWMRTTRHGMPQGATEETGEGEYQERCFGYIHKSRGIEYRDAID